MSTKLDLVDAVITLHNIARLIETEIGNGKLAEDIRNCADRLHEIAVRVRIVVEESETIIKKAKE